MITENNILLIASENWKKENSLYPLYKEIIFDDNFPIEENIENQKKYLSTNYQYSKHKELVNQLIINI